MGTGVAGPNGVTFGPTENGKMYISVDHHRGEPNAQKSTWHPAISRINEYEVFFEADRLICRDPAGNYWGIANGGRTVLGSRNERIAKFPATVNAIDAWHGYPVSPNRRGEMDAPPDTCIAVWRNANAIDRVWEARLKRRAI